MAKMQIVGKKGTAEGLFSLLFSFKFFLLYHQFQASSKNSREIWKCLVHSTVIFKGFCCANAAEIGFYSLLSSPTVTVLPCYFTE